MAVNAFYIAVGVFGTSTAIMGPWIERNGPRAGVLGATSFFIVAFGLCYISPVSALQKWFPDYRGAAAGFAVGDTVLVPSCGVKPTPYHRRDQRTRSVHRYWMRHGVHPLLLRCVSAQPALRLPRRRLEHARRAVREAQESFQRGEKVSVMSSHEYEAIMTPTARDVEAMVDPAAQNTNSQVKKMTLIQAITSPDFIFLYIMFFGNQLYGLIVLSKLSTMCTTLFGKTADQGADIVSINGVFNCVGRLLFPLISDVIVRKFNVEHAFGRKCLFYYALVSQITIIAIFPTLIRNESYTAFVVLVFLLTLSYGGGFGTIPCFLTDMFGAFNIGAMHGFILTAWSLGGVAGGLTFNAKYNDAIKNGSTPVDAYVDSIYKILIVVCVTGIFIFMVRTNPRDRFDKGYHYSLFGKRVISIKPKDTTANKEGLLQSEV
ncbi:hypothetical protein AM588_10000167 [Phytophthora nicotianae]|uniref:Major Facilitator Superfamily (MFS) n=1 Tax=Phytophthora nicotianae TaxID=4792 RepID=A0A0W8C7S0_PHYNI|nr:hypothetical protein AM588_10000167 [Phytophthora nicotianae]